MNKVSPYISFNGNCKEAMKFYKQCFGGVLFLQTVGEAPHSAKMPVRMKQAVLHATLSNGDFMLTGSDMVRDEELIKSNSVSVLIDCDSEMESRKIYEKLAKGGKRTQPLQVTFWGALFGTITDKYGIQWLINYSNK